MILAVLGCFVTPSGGHHLEVAESRFSVDCLKLVSGCPALTKNITIEGEADHHQAGHILEQRQPHFLCVGGWNATLRKHCGRVVAM